MAVPQYCDEVLVTLSSLNPSSSFAFPDRRIFLTKENPIMEIGRTSKRNSSLEAAKNNAWFDSAVMSREHAQVRLDAAKQKVYIQDTGSLHGTFQNEVRLPAHYPSSVKTGDILRFGISIDRGSDKYPPCIMEARTQFGTASVEDRPKVFRVPDDTDVEYSSSDDDQSIRNSSKIARKIIIQPWSKRKSGSPTRSPIDLTAGEQYPISSVRDDQDHTVSALPPVSSTTKPPSDPKCVDLTSQSEDEEYERNGFSPISLRAHWLLGLEGQADDAKSSASHEMELMGSSGDESHSPSPSPGSSPSPSPSLSPSLCSSPNLAEDSLNAIDQGHITGCEEVGENEEEQYEEDEFDELDEFQNSEDVCEPSRPLPTPPVQAVPAQNVASDSYNPHPLAFAVGIVPEASLTHMLGPGATDCYTGHLPPLESSNVRLPAFALNNTASQSFVKLPSLTEATSHHRFSPSQGPPFKSLVEVLGQKTGKFDYFAAREENKMNACSPHSTSNDDSMQSAPVNQGAPLNQSTQTSQGSSLNAEHGPNAPSLETFSSEAIVDEQMEVNIQAQTDTAEGAQSPTCMVPLKWPSSPGLPQSFTTAQSQEPRTGRPSAFDAASAYEFEQMCLEAEDEPQPESHAHQIQKSHQRRAQTGAQTEPAEQEPLVSNTAIDISESPSNSHDKSAPTQRSAKRRAAEISQLTPEEERAENQIPAPILSVQLPPRRVAKHKRHNMGDLRGSSSRHNLVVSELPAPRPTKRLRRVAEVFGYAALGGVAVMSALIATAPTL